MRRENRIHTIQASLAMEQNSLSLEQVTALFDGQRVIGPARDIQEVRNAIAAYEALPRWDPANRQHLLEAHGLLMAGLIAAPGRFRNGGVGIYRADQLLHMAPPAARVQALVGELLAWLPIHSARPTSRAPSLGALILQHLSSDPNLSARQLAELRPATPGAPAPPE